MKTINDLLEHVMLLPAEKEVKIKMHYGDPEPPHPTVSLDHLEELWKSIVPKKKPGEREFVIHTSRRGGELFEKALDDALKAEL
jgi:hypothetical protein